MFSPLVFLRPLSASTISVLPSWVKGPGRQQRAIRPDVCVQDHGQ